MKWKFIHNGTSWWLRIETAEQLSEYIRLTDGKRFGTSFDDARGRCSRKAEDDLVTLLLYRAYVVGIDDHIVFPNPHMTVWF